ncbi:c-type cytochrome [Thermus caliditerrae]|uniref:c-type cytochrome n=1 Tax=Thermus caliditerrae TaxID=1330700 RepID=UPI0009DCF1CC|nr:c-type cytochrome [Thermus caliditerrae]
MLAKRGLMVLAFGLLLGVLGQNAPDPWRIQRGGQLYDHWIKAKGVEAPAGDHPLWALQNTNTRKGTDTWRCKECHGWDYLGKDGAYGSGSHFTGFAGVLQVRDKSLEEILALLKGSKNPKHDFSPYLSQEDLEDLALFLKYGTWDPRTAVDYKAKKPLKANPDLAQGRSIYRVCASCHGEEGKNINFGTEEAPEYVGTLAKDNPQEILHKIRIGQPGNFVMPGFSFLSLDQLQDLLAYLQTLPSK